MVDKQVVIITGGSSGIGKALAFEFGTKGFRVAITGRNQPALNKTIDELKQKEIDVIGIQADASIEGDNQKMADTVMEHFGRINILIANAGISMKALLEEVNTEVIQKVMEVNFYGALYAIKACLPYIIKSKGSIVGISSIAGFRGLPARAGYSASKFALQGLLEVLRTEMLYKGVHVLIASPGFTASNIRKRALMADGSAQGESPRDESKEMSAEAVARRIYRATIKKKRYLILTTKGKLTVFLNKFFPAWMDKMVYKALAREKNSPFK